MTSPLPLLCATCSEPISLDDLAQGLAVRVDGRAVCAMCVDLLPGKAQFEINKLRALKGLNATTYHVQVPAHPDHQRFTFTTAGNVLSHNRSLKTTGEFHAPLLQLHAPPIAAPARSPSSSTVNQAKASSTTLTAGRLADPIPDQRARPSLLLITLLGLIVVLVGVLIGVLHRGQRIRQEVAHSELLASPTRSSYPSDPFEAWVACTTDPRCPPEVQLQVRDQLRQQANADLVETQRRITDHDFAAAASLLDRIHLPEHPTFADLRQRSLTVSGELMTARLAARAESPAVNSSEGSSESSSTRADAVPVTTAPSAIDQRPSSESDPPSVDSAPAALHRPLPTPALAPNSPRTLAAIRSECWMIPVHDLVPERSPEWTAAGDLTGLSGRLGRTLPPLRGGTYQVWVLAMNARKRGSLVFSIDSHALASYPGAQAFSSSWHLLDDHVVLAPGVHTLSALASGAQWHVTQIYLAGADRAHPEPSPADATLPPWNAAHVETTPVADPPAGAQRQVVAWKRAYVWPLKAKDEPLDGSASIPSPWPFQAPPFIRAQRMPGAQGLTTLSLEIDRDTVIGGGMVLLLHRVRADRKQLLATLEWTTVDNKALDTHTSEPRPHLERTKVPLDPLVFRDANDWQSFAVPFPDLKACPARVWLRLEDSADFGLDGRGFLLAQALTVANGHPELDDLHLVSSPLIAGDVITDEDYRRKLIALCDRAASHKRGQHPWNETRWNDPRKFKLLLVKGEGAWEREMQRRLVQQLGLKPTAHDLLDNMLLSDSWFQDHQFHNQQPLIDPDDALLAVMVLNGEEGTTTLQDPDELLHWVDQRCTKLLDGDQGHRGGLLPVFVIGRTTRLGDAAVQGAIDRAWSKVRQKSFDEGIPLIDIRNAQFAGDNDDPGDLAQQLLVDGLQTLIYQLAWLQKSVHP